MTYKEIKRTANKLIKAVKGKTDFVSIEQYLETIGYKVAFYNTPNGDKLLAKLDLLSDASDVPAFTYTGAGNIVFIDDNVSSEDKNYLLYHEVGHILLGHLSYARMSTKNRYNMEYEADVFAHMLLHPSNKKKLIACIIGFIAVAFLSFYVGYVSAPMQMLPTSATEQTTEQVYITSTGKKYHRSNCRYVKGKDNIAVIDKKQADKTHSPCSVCNP